MNYFSRVSPASLAQLTVSNFRLTSAQLVEATNERKGDAGRVVEGRRGGGEGSERASELASNCDPRPAITATVAIGSDATAPA